MFQDLVGQFVLLSGFAAFVAALVDLLKKAGVVKDGWAPTWALGFNILGFVIFAVAKVIAPDLDIAVFDGAFAAVASVLIAILQIVGQQLLSRLTHYGLRGAFLVGTSHSQG